MQRFLNNIIHLTAYFMVLIVVTACGESEVEKAARRQNEADEAMKKIFHRIEPKGGNPRY